MKGEFSEKTKRVLAKRAGEKCSLCSKSTSKPHSSNSIAFINLGEAAHIKGIKNGPNLRYDELMTDDQRSEISNAIWLCQGCHKEIDSDCSKYSVIVLLEIKKKHENKVFLGEFDIAWKEKIQLEKLIDSLEGLIIEKNKSAEGLEFKYNSELTDLKIKLEKLTLEKDEFESALNKLENSISGLNLDDTNSQSILNAYKTGDLEKVKYALDDPLLESGEIELAKKRLIRGNIAELERDYENAEVNYEKASRISSSQEIFEFYVLFLSKVGKIDKAIQESINLLNDRKNSTSNIWLNNLIGELYLSVNKSALALEYLINGQEAIKSDLIANPERHNIDEGQILVSLGTAHRNMGKHEQALLDYQAALNVFFQMSLKTGELYATKVGNLFNYVGLLYLENNDPKEAIGYFLKAVNCFSEENEKDELSLSVVYMNIVNVYNHYKTLDISKSQEYINSSQKLLEKFFDKKPLKYFEYYVGILIKSADNNLMLTRIQEAKINYEKALNLVEEFKARYDVFYATTTALVYSNYAVFLFSTGDKSNSITYSNRAIQALLTMEDSEHTKHFNLGRTYMFLSELTENEIEKTEIWKKAHNHLLLCNDMTIAKAWKFAVEEKLKTSPNSN